jgi:hypothetical protein
VGTIARNMGGIQLCTGGSPAQAAQPGSGYQVSPELGGRNVSSLDGSTRADTKVSRKEKGFERTQ